MRELNFSPGTAVEVNIDPDNSCDVWFPATFIKQVNKNSFLVEYQCSREAGLQKVTVDSSHIRPSPACSSSKAFNLLEKVDAFCDHHWLSGVVTKILADGKYIVYFKHTKKEKELFQADLRLHMEWTNGKWVSSSQDNSKSSNSEKKSDHAVNDGCKENTCLPAGGTGAVKENVEEETLSAVTLKSCQKVLQTPGSENANHNGIVPSNKRIKQTRSNACKSKMKQPEGSNERMAADLDTTTPSTPEKSSLKQSEDSDRPSASTEIKGGDEKHPVTRKRGRPRKLRALLPDAVNETSDAISVMSPLGQPIVIGLTHNGKMIPLLSASSGQHMKEAPKKTVEDEEKDHETSADHENAVDDGGGQQKDGEVTNLTRKRGRPPKVSFRVGSPKTKESEFVEESKDAVSDAEDNPERDSSTNEVDKFVTVVEPVGISDSTPSTEPRKRSVKMISDQFKRLSDIRELNTRNTARTSRKHWKISKEIVTEDMNQPVRRITPREGRQQRYYKQVEPSTEDAADDSRDRATEALNSGVAKDVETVVARTSSNVSDDDRPLSAWFEGAHSPPTTDGRLPLPRTACQCDETGEPAGQPKEKAQEKKDEKTPDPERQDEISVHSTAIVAVNNQDLPFVKNSLIWEMIESMEVFKRIPQRPHFLPLYNCKEECREGLAIGNMVTFTSLVERVSRLQFGDPKSLLDGYLDALFDLEELGFDVTPVRDQLNTLLAIKGKHEQAQNTSKEIESQIMERKHEKSKISEEIVELDKMIAELNEKRASAMSRKELKVAAITLLQSSVNAVKGSLDSAEEEFKKVAASLW